MQTVIDLQGFLYQAHAVMDRQSQLLFTSLMASEHNPSMQPMQQQILYSAQIYAYQSCSFRWLSNFFELSHDSNLITDDDIVNMVRATLAQDDDLSLQKKKNPKLNQNRSFLTPNFKYDSFPEVMDRHLTLAPHLQKRIRRKHDSVLPEKEHIHFETAKCTMQLIYQRYDANSLKEPEAISGFMVMAEHIMNSSIVNECGQTHVEDYFKHNDGSPYVDGFILQANTAELKDKLNQVKYYAASLYEHPKDKTSDLAHGYNRNNYHPN